MKPAIPTILHFTALIFAATAEVAEDPGPLMKQVDQMARKLAADDGFTDEDATKVSIFLMEKLVGPTPADQKQSTRTVSSTPTSVRIEVAYDAGLAGTIFEFEFMRGNVAKGERFAHFMLLQRIPSE